MWNKIRLLLLISLMIIIGTACGTNAEISYSGHESLVKLNQDGTVVLTVKDVFDKDYYKEDELVAMVNEEITQFNNENGQGSISLGQHSVNGKEVSLELIFSSVDAYNKYNPSEEIYSGTVGDAVKNGYDLNRSLSIAGKKSGTIGKNDLVNMNDSNLIIVKTPYIIETPGKIGYYSQGMEYINSNEVAVSGNGVYFIIYK